MSSPSYFAPKGGHPPQTDLLSGRAVFTDAYAVLPKGTMRDIVTSFLPFWEGTRLWVIARPMTGFAETFSQYIMEVQPGGGSTRPEQDPQAQGVLFVVEGGFTLTIGEARHEMRPGSYAYLPAGQHWTLQNDSGAVTRFHWIRKRYEAVEGLDHPDPLVLNEADIAPNVMPDTNGVWATTRFVDPEDLRHDMHVTIVTLQPGGVIPFCETHVMEHGLYVLEGKAVYRLNQDWVEVEAGDFMWLRAFCPQACYAGGPGPFRYLLYKDVNRHMKLGFGDLGQSYKGRAPSSAGTTALPNDIKTSEAKVCPECGHVFKGSGWDGIDAHWRSKHEDIMPYEIAWPLLKAGTYSKESE